MGREDTLKHTTISNTALPYFSNGSVTSTDIHWSTGSLNLRTTIGGTAELRPGTTPIDDAVFVGVIKRIYTWQHTEGSDTAFFIMVCCTQGNTSSVYKKKIGTDATFSHLLTDLTSNNPFDFVEANNTLFMGNDVLMKKYDGTTLSNWGIEAPGVRPTFSVAGGGAITLTTGRTYVYAWGNSLTGHIGPASAPSLTSTGAITNSMVTVTWGVTTDTQVDEVHVYATTDGGEGTYFELPNSPSPYIAGGSIVDNAPDGSLLTVTAPAPGTNDPPPPGHGFVWYAERIWYFRNQVLVFTGNEEVTNGVGYETLPVNNFRVMPRAIAFAKPAGEFLLCGTSSTVYRIWGDALENFRFEPFLEHMGARHSQNATSYSRTCAWLDTARVVRLTDGLSQSEVSVPIRPDLNTINQREAAVCAHDNGQNHWLVVVDGEEGRSLIYDFDTAQWNPPWTWAVTAAHSGEIASGDYALLLGGRDGRLLKVVPSTNDSGVPYEAIAKLGLMEITPSSQPSRLGFVDHIALELTRVPSDVGLLVDDDPNFAGYTSLKDTEVPTQLRTQGTYLQEWWYYARKPLGRRASVQMTWDAEDAPMTLNTVDLCWTVADR